MDAESWTGAPKLQNRLLTRFFSSAVPPVPQDNERRIFPKRLNPLLAILFSWLIPVLRVGYKRTLEPNDLFQLNEDVQCSALAARFEKVFLRRLAEDKAKWETKQKNAGTSEEYMPLASLCTFSVLETFKWQYLLACLLMCTGIAASTCVPLISRKLIAFVQYRAAGVHNSTGKGVGYALGLVVLILLGNILVNQGFYFSTLTGAQIKGLFTKVLLDKSFRLSEKSRKKFPPSVITSIMSTDVSRVDLGVGFSPWMFIAPVPLAVAIGILIYNIKAPALAGLGVMFLYVVAVGVLGTLLFMYRIKAMKQTDIRVGYMKEILNNLKMIKFYSWEIPYFDLVRQTRGLEMSLILKMDITRSVIIAAATSLTLLASYVAFMVMFAISDDRSPALIFPSVALFGMLAGVFIMVPLSVANGTDAFIGMRRVGDFLAAEEKPEDQERLMDDEKQQDLDEKDIAVEVTNATFEWELFDEETDGEKEKAKKKNDKSARNTNYQSNKIAKIEEETSNDSDSSRGSSLTANLQPAKKQTFTLSNLDFAIQKGEFVVITGLIGSGKSSLLQALNGKMKRNSGSVRMNGSDLLCGTPWIQNSTVKENITFNLAFEEKWYKKVLQACSLESDLDILPAGDMTEIGERGITLSGGQKARINLARAVYSCPEIILLDDVLSAVDLKVGRKIMDECILGILQGKTRILATHQLSLIGAANRIFYLNGDGTLEVGTLDSLMASSPGFKTLMEHRHETDTKEDEKEQEEQQEIVRSLTAKETAKLAQEDGKLITEEQKSVNAIGWSVYSQYFKAGAQGFRGYWIIPAVLCFTALELFLNLFAYTWLSFWIERKFDYRDSFYIGIYSLIVFTGIIAIGSHFAGVIYIMNRASRILNIKAVEKVLHVPMAYMDTTPMGRIINRFTKDTDVLDNEMCDKIAMIVHFFGFICGVLILCIVYLPWFAIAVPFLLFIFFTFAEFYQASGREIKRVEAIQRSFVYSNFNETLTGIDTIKDYNSEKVFMDKNVKLVDRMNEAYFITVANQRWFDVVLSFLTTAFALLISLLCVFRVFNISASSVGLLLSFMIQLSSTVSTAVVMYTQVEQDMNSTERILEYTYKLPQEASYVKLENTPNKNWPERGEISFENVNLSYRPGLPLALKNFTANISAGEKVGICGRTGAGKSSIMVSIYRIAELESGKITIDDLDIGELGLFNLRLKLSIIPQDPVLFRGTIRTNLDPFESKSDEELWDILKRAQIIDSDVFHEVKTQTKENPKLHKFHLEQSVEDEGANFSLGEKQLIAFARALVRGTQILILDEATSSVDYATDSKIQRAIAREFSQCTILCIAHRLNTILDYDRIMVLEQGQLVEFDTPLNLFNANGHFRSMCEKSHISQSLFRS